MAYPEVTPAQFKTAKPQFTEVANETVQVYLDLAGLWVDQSWPEKFYAPALIAATCHLMTLDGLGRDPQSILFASGAANFQSVKSGELTLTRYSKEAGSQSFSDWLLLTSCGAFFWQLLKAVRGGPRVAMGGIGGAQSGYAKDVPGNSIPGWWGAR